MPVTSPVTAERVYTPPVPRFNRLGQFAAGAAGGVLSVDARPIGQGGGARWIDDATVIANATLTGDDPYHTFAFDGPSWVPRELDGRGATRLGAGGGNWAATLASRTDPQTYGVYRGQPLPDDLATYYALDGGLDGSLVLVDTISFTTFVVLWADGERSTFEARHVDGGSVRVCDSAHAIILCAGGPPTAFVYHRASGTVEPAGLLGAGQYFPYLYVEADVVYALYWAEEYGLVLQVMGTQTGWQALGAPYFNPDVYPATRQIAYSLDAAESPAMLRLMVATGAPAPLVPAKPPVPPTIPPFARPVSIASFFPEQT